MPTAHSAPNTAWFFEPYKDDPSTTGLPTDYMLNGKFKEWALLADKNKIQLAVHAIGDRAVSEVLDVFEEVSKINPPWDRRFRIEHVQHIKEKDIERMKKLNVIASMQPSQLYDDGVWAEEKVGKERLKGTHAVKTLLDHGIKVCLGSDWTVTPLDVIHGIDIAVNRKLKDNSKPDGWIPSEKISVEEAIKAYTIDAAYACFEEDIKGSIEVGKLADFVVLSEDIFEISTEKISDVNIDKTVFNGKEL
ncbi:MAG: amidohydrolase family protein [Melioribacteraceae bacterium]|nr:amidohydrolase family protein [Melioribacteraceae bacterium]